MKLTKRHLELMGACQDAIDFFEEMKFEGITTKQLNKIKGDYKGYTSKLLSILKRCKFDENDNLLSYTTYDNTVIIYVYDENNNVIARYEKDQSNLYTYKDNKLVKSVYNVGNGDGVISYYDKNGLLIKEEDILNTDHITTYEYKHGKLYKEQTSSGLKLYYGYNMLNGDRIIISKNEIEVEYDKNGNCVLQKTDRVTAKYKYNADGICIKAIVEVSDQLYFKQGLYKDVWECEPSGLWAECVTHDYNEDGGLYNLFTRTWKYYPSGELYMYEAKANKDDNIDYEIKYDDLEDIKYEYFYYPNGQLREIHKTSEHKLTKCVFPLVGV